MNLWSKGLGRMVLDIRLSERSGMQAEPDRAVIRGAMGAPVFWDYAVRLSGEDVLDFLDLLRQPPVVSSRPPPGSVGPSSGRRCVGAVVFAWAFASRLITRPAMTRTAQPARSHFAGRRRNRRQGG